MKHTNVMMKHADGRQTEVNKESVSEMEVHGWKAVPGSEKEHEAEPVHSARVFNDELKDHQIIHTHANGRRVVVHGPDAVLAPAPAPVQKPAETKVANNEMSTEELEAKYAAMTKADIKELLDAREIKYGENETKAELIVHLTEGK